MKHPMVVKRQVSGAFVLYCQLFVCAGEAAATLRHHHSVLLLQLLETDLVAAFFAEPLSGWTASSPTQPTLPPTPLLRLARQGGQSNHVQTNLVHLTRFAPPNLGRGAKMTVGGTAGDRGWRTGSVGGTAGEQGWRTGWVGGIEPGLAAGCRVACVCVGWAGSSAAHGQTQPLNTSWAAPCAWLAGRQGTGTWCYRPAAAERGRGELRLLGAGAGTGGLSSAATSAAVALLPLPLPLPLSALACLRFGAAGRGPCFTCSEGGCFVCLGGAPTSAALS